MVETIALETEFNTRLKTCCSPNELLGYLTAMMNYSGYSSEVTLYNLEDLDIAVTHFRMWSQSPGMAKLGAFSLLIINKIRKLNHPIVFKISSVLDHAEAILEVASSDDCFMHKFVPSVN